MRSDRGLYLEVHEAHAAHKAEEYEVRPRPIRLKNTQYAVLCETCII